MTRVYNRLQNCTALLICDTFTNYFVLVVCFPLHCDLCAMGSCLIIEWDWSPPTKNTALPSLNRQFLSLMTRESPDNKQLGVQNLLKSLREKTSLSLPVVQPCSRLIQLLALIHHNHCFLLLIKPAWSLNVEKGLRRLSMRSISLA